MVEFMKQGGTKLGYLMKEKFDGEFFKAWSAVINENDFELVAFFPFFSIHNSGRR